MRSNEEFEATQVKVAQAVVKGKETARENSLYETQEGVSKRRQLKPLNGDIGKQTAEDENMLNLKYERTKQVERY